jgi:transcriptional regulator with XRE-family HTH domain
MDKQATRTFKTALRNTRKEQRVSLQELGLRINSDASHIFKIEHGQDVTLSTMLKLANALGVAVTFGSYTLSLDTLIRTKSKRAKSP